ncbi:T-complex protein 11-like protein 1 [Schistocerca piceifrons]|uniref:T-complex protein 11-like protein 1 n=1 Tax=Schistocerca piceifrons TaxID=274613 RepID=UPI001F5E41BE|nr:T-complex protein 11-like protein 1 [Schistocerca piceifrons]XP_047121451.1 T-complex protein 11-like protein 1 [Schistocerca piceifrons]XP_047121452.1 T-complex protein 11-like protein 1 [Schistocerca piceifrons]XP_049937706.1 T-complex protein 11-like protein 1 [Schistocerca serialis cubense]XP_049937707.1 T-complex protein 11-like protein 1 [Schistocerca serialis cubense]XP_049937708.1 T-complex protein 11-like protein 1 [Schistocerca serialis cubense]XP_049937709.1 T-complex protein 11
MASGGAPGNENDENSPLENSTTLEDDDGAAASSSTRQRYDSEGNASDSSSSSSKRLRITPGYALPVPGIAASPPKFVSLEEIMQAAKGLNNMALAHEIAVDKNFELQRLDPPEDSLHKRVKETMKKAFWDLLSLKLSEDPPDYSQAMNLLRDIKEYLFSLLLPQHVKLKEEISDLLDEDIIQQQVDAGTLNFQDYAQCVIAIMGKLCAPIRDEKIKELSETKDVVAVFKGILETLELMRLDMANFTIKMFRPDIIASSVEYEKTKFAEFLKIQPDGLAHTRAWLKRHLRPGEGPDPAAPAPEVEIALRSLTQLVLGRAYLELLEWDRSVTFPETLIMDEVRYLDLGDQTLRLSVMGSILLVVTSVVSALVGNTSFKTMLKDHLTVLLAEVHSNQDLTDVMPNVSLQIIKDVNDSLVECGFSQLDETATASLTSQISSVALPEHKVKQLVRLRIMEFLELTITSPTAAPVQVPPGLSFLKAELTTLTGQFLRLVSHNRAVYGEYYSEIIADAVKSAKASP